MQVRDHTKSVKEYKGHWTIVVDALCPCRPCYNAHDCTPPNPAYSKTAYSDVFHCASNWNSGCPQPKPEPQHILNRLNNCKRCRVHVPTYKEVIGTINRVAEEKNVKIETIPADHGTIVIIKDGVTLPVSPVRNSKCPHCGCDLVKDLEGARKLKDVRLSC